MQKTDIRYTYTMEYYSTIKKNEILLFATAVMDLEDIILREVRQKDTYHNVPYMWNLNVKNKASSKVERTDWWLPEV